MASQWAAKSCYRLFVSSKGLSEDEINDKIDVGDVDFFIVVHISTLGCRFIGRFAQDDANNGIDIGNIDML